MPKITPALRISIGLVILTISVILLAQALGLSPNPYQQQIDSRQRMAELLANQTALAITRGDSTLLSNLIESLFKNNPEVRSIGIRKNDNSLLFSTDNHTNLWLTDGSESPADQLTIPIIINAEKRASLELSYTPILDNIHPLFGIPTFFVFIIFFALSSFIGIWLFIRRTLNYLDPSAVVPSRVRNALNILTEGVLILDKREQVILINQSLCEKISRKESEIIGRKASTLGWKLRHQEGTQDYPWNLSLAQGERLSNIQMTLPENSSKRQKKEVIFSVNSVPILDPKDQPQGTIAVFDDISEMEEKNLLLEKLLDDLTHSRADIEAKNKELAHMATRDPLTDCYNRRALHDYLDRNLPHALKNKEELCCIMGDIDHFKRVNDNYGHGTGDLVIKMMADAIRSVLRESDIIARIGGEEFCIILRKVDIETVYNIADRCRTTIASQLTEGVKVTASFGVSSIKDGAQTDDELIHQADLALYASKESGRNRVTRWHRDIEDKGNNQSAP